MNEPIRPKPGDERLLRSRPADDAVRPGRSVFDDDLDDDYDEEDEFDDDYDEEEDDEDDDVPMPHWSKPATGQAPATKSGDADAWTTLTGSQPRWRESAADYDDEPEVATTAAEYDSEAAAEEFFEFDDEGDADFQRFIGDEPAGVADDDDDLAPIPITNAGSTARAHAGAGATARSATKKAAAKTGARADARPAARRRNDMRARVVTGAVLAVLAIAAFMSGAAATVGLISIVLGLCVIELSNALRRAGYQPATLLAIVAAVGAPVAVYQRGVDGLLVVIAISTVFSLLWFLSKAGDESPVLNAGVTMLSRVVHRCPRLLWRVDAARIRPLRHRHDSRRGTGHGRPRHRGTARRSLGRQDQADIGQSGQDTRRPHRRHADGDHRRGGGRRHVQDRTVRRSAGRSLRHLGRGHAPGGPARPRDRGDRAARRSRRVAHQARPRRQGHGQHPQGPRWCTRPVRCAAVHAACHLLRRAVRDPLRPPRYRRRERPPSAYRRGHDHDARRARIDRFDRHADPRHRSG